MNPTKKQVQVVIDTLQSAKDKTTEMGYKAAPVNMMDVHLEGCGTPMCHAGYYAIMNSMDDYEDGANKMAKDLGFKNSRDLLTWALDNPEIWGNKNGNGMFSAPISFGIDTPTAIGDLQVIIDHWKGVQSRLAE